LCPSVITTAETNRIGECDPEIDQQTLNIETPQRLPINLPLSNAKTSCIDALRFAAAENPDSFVLSFA
jgi:hypothetical protein